MSTRLLEEDVMEMLIDHYENPKNMRVIENADIEQKGGNPGCGDDITIYMSIKGDKIVDSSFDGEGCIISQSTSSILTEYIRDKSIAEVSKLDSEFLRNIIGKDIMIRRPQCSRLALETIRFGLKNYLKQHRK